MVKRKRSSIVSSQPFPSFSCAVPIMITTGLFWLQGFQCKGDNSIMKKYLIYCPKFWIPYEWLILNVKIFSGIKCQITRRQRSTSRIWLCRVCRQTESFGCFEHEWRGIIQCIDLLVVGKLINQLKIWLNKF